MAKKAGHTRRKVSLSLNTDGGANPADAAGADINKIMAKFFKTGTLPNVGQTNPLYGDFTFPEDIHSVREAVHEAEDRFMDLPSSVRSTCNNDWVTFYDKFRTEDGQAELIESGLTIGTPPIDPDTITPATPPPDPSPPVETPPDPIT